jgi:hypothetical protein
MKQRLLNIAWPSFLVAGLLEMVVFALVDPDALHHLNGELIELSRPAIYTLAFFLFWAAAFVSAALSLWMAEGGSPASPDRHLT